MCVPLTLLETSSQLVTLRHIHVFVAGYLLEWLSRLYDYLVKVHMDTNKIVT